MTNRFPSPEDRVRFLAGSRGDNLIGKILLSHGRNPGSIPGRSTVWPLGGIWQTPRIQNPLSFGTSRFESGRGYWFNMASWWNLADTVDLKSAVLRDVPVRIRERLPCRQTFVGVKGLSDGSGHCLASSCIGVRLSAAPPPDDSLPKTGCFVESP